MKISSADVSEFLSNYMHSLNKNTLEVQVVNENGYFKTRDNMLLIYAGRDLERIENDLIIYWLDGGAILTDNISANCYGMLGNCCNREQAEYLSEIINNPGCLGIKYKEGSAHKYAYLKDFLFEITRSSNSDCNLDALSDAYFTRVSLNNQGICGYRIGMKNLTYSLNDELNFLQEAFNTGIKSPEMGIEYDELNYFIKHCFKVPFVIEVPPFLQDKLMEEARFFEDFDVFVYNIKGDTYYFCNDPNWNRFKGLAGDVKNFLKDTGTDILKDIIKKSIGL